jgi:FkbM family methyltransferase
MTLFFKILFKEFYHLVRDARHRQFLRLVFRHGDAPRYQPRQVRFGGYRIRVPDCLSFLWQFKEIFAEESYCFRAGTESPVIYDCGANVGLGCLYFKRLYPAARITAFEADPGVAALLAENLRQNGFADIDIVAKAVWKENTTLAFASEGADGGSVVAGKPTTRIPAVRLKEYLDRAGRVDLLKMDIEGAEADVLEDCRGSLGGVQHLFVEYHAYTGQPQRLDALLGVLGESGFRYFIRSEADRARPFVNRVNSGTPYMDLQLNIFAYR